MVCGLSGVVISPHGVSQLLFHALLLAIAFILLFVSRFGHVDHVDQSLFRQTQTAGIVGGHLRISVVLTLLAYPVNIAT